MKLILLCLKIFISFITPAMLVGTLSLAAISLTACGGKEETTAASTDPDDDEPDDPDSAPPTEVNGLGFYVKNISSGKYTHYMSKGATFNSDCLISTTSTTEDITCRIDAQEADLNFHGLKLNVNVPPNVCTYMRATPYFYYNREVGVGPSAISLAITETANGSSVTSCSVTGSSGTTNSCNTLEVSIATTDGTPTCVYDRSTDTGGKNCCFGNYQLTKTVTNTVDMTVTTSVSNANWGGDYSECIGGPGKTSWDAHSVNGLPAQIVYFSENDGVIKTYDIKGPMSNKFTENYSVANYYGDLSHSHTGFVSAIVSTMPYAVDPIDDRDGTLLNYTNDSYMFECLDAAFEVKHRIRVYVREWNTYSQFLLYGTSNGVNGDPDTGGIEDGVSCVHGFAQLCNDFWDFDDLLNSQDGDMTVTTDVYDTDPGSESLRRGYFPME